MLAPALAARGIEVSVVGGPSAELMTGGTSAVRHRPAVTVRDAIGALRRLPHIDVVNTHMTDADAAGLVHGILRSRTHVVSTRHFAAVRGSSAPIRRGFALFAGRFAAQISISRVVADSIGEASTVIHTGVHDADVDAAAPRERRVLVAQRLEPEKDTATAIRAWAASRGPDDGWRLTVAGDGSQRAELERLASHLGVRDTVDFVGHSDDVPKLLSTSAVLIAPTPREGLGLSVLEAMAAGLPVVASASGGHLETAGAVADAALFAPGEPRCAAEQLDRLLVDPQGRIAYGRRLQAFQREEFGIERQIERTVEVYQDAVDG